MLIRVRTGKGDHDLLRNKKHFKTVFYIKKPGSNLKSLASEAYQEGNLVLLLCYGFYVCFWGSDCKR